MSRVPRIRFKGFEEDWEQRKLGECFTERIESMPNGELISVTINDGIKKFSELGRHDNSNDDKSKYKKVCVGDIAYNSMRMWQGASGYSPYEGIVSPAYTVLAANHGVNSRCIAHQFKLSKMIHTFKINSQGITSDNWNLKFPALSDIPIYISKQIDEQCKIAFFLENLDHLITLHQRKLEKLKIIKKSMLENLFPQNGEKTPKIRFSGFNEDWEQRKLGEYLIQYTEVTIINDQYPVLTSSRKGIFFQKDYYDGNQIASENNIGYNIVPYGYFTYRHMSDDEIFYFNINNIIDNGIVSTLYPVFTTNNRLDSKFLQYELNFGKEFRKYSVLQKQGGSRTYMYFNKLRELKLTITTSLKEQECIRNLICSIDHLITLHQSKLEKLQKIKKSMLESMFV